MPLALRRLLAVLALALAPGCLTVTPPASAFASEPPGARVYIDGQDSGWVTPCLIALDPEETHAVSLELDGFTPYTIELRPSLRVHVIDWDLGATGAQSTIHVPIFLPPEDLARPFRVDDGLQPARIFARLRPKEES